MKCFPQFQFLELVLLIFLPPNYPSRCVTRNKFPENFPPKNKINFETSSSSSSAVPVPVNITESRPSAKHNSTMGGSKDGQQQHTLQNSQFTSSCQASRTTPTKNAPLLSVLVDSFISVSVLFFCSFCCCAINFILFLPQPPMTPTNQPTGRSSVPVLHLLPPWTSACRCPRSATAS